MICIQLNFIYNKTITYITVRLQERLTYRGR